MKKDKATLNDEIGGENYRQTIQREFRRHRLVCFSLAVLAIIYAAAVLTPIVVPYDLEGIAGLFSAAPSLKFIFGTGQIGRDMLNHLLYVTRVSLLVGMLVTAISTAIGVVLGLLGGYLGGWLDIAIVRFTDIVMSSPYVLPVLVVTAVFEPGFQSIILALGSVDWPGVARLVRDNVLSLWETNSVKGSIVMGMPARHVLFSEILPNAMAPVLVYAASTMALSMLDEVSLSFLGMDVQPPAVSLGNMLNSAQSLTVLTRQPWLWTSPGFLTMILVVTISFMGDALRDALDLSAVMAVHKPASADGSSSSGKSASTQEKGEIAE